MQNSYAELFSAFGGVGFLDRIESAGFNRLPAPYLNGSMWSMQYFHKTNAIGGCNAYGLPFECCVANGNQGWPRFTSHLYALPKLNDDGSQDLAALLYAPSTLDTILPAAPDSSDSTDGREPRSAIRMNARRRAIGSAGSAGGNRVRIKLDTEYPFREELKFAVEAEAAFKLRLRIPQWAVQPTLALGSAAPAVVAPGADGFHIVELPAGASELTLRLPMEVRVEEEQAGGVSVHAGALLFALDLAPKEHNTGPGGCYYPPDGCEIAALVPSVNWRQALLLDKSAGASGGLSLERVEAGGAAGSAPPFNRASVALRIRAKAAVLANSSWPTVNCTSMESGCHDCVGPIPSSSAVEEARAAEEGEVTLLPFGATDIRMGVMPATWR